MEKINYHYKKRYDRLIEHYQQNLPEGFVEKHPEISRSILKKYLTGILNER